MVAEISMVTWNYLLLYWIKVFSKRKLLPLEKFQDTNLWVNVHQIVQYKAVDLSQYDHEVYIYERPHFNQPTLYLAIVLERKGRKEFEFIRKNGAYWNGLLKNYQDQNYLLSMNGQEKYNLNFEVVGEFYPYGLVSSHVYSFQNGIVKVILMQ